MVKFKDLVVKDSITPSVSDPIRTNIRENNISTHINVGINMKVFYSPDSYACIDEKLKEILDCIEDKRELNSLLTIRHYAEMNNLAKETVRQRIKKGTLPYVLIDGIYFIKENL